MQYLKREINKLLPLALLCGALGGVLLIVVANMFEPGKMLMAVSYAIVIGVSVYTLNRIRFKQDMIGSILYGYIVYTVMTSIAFIDLVMNAQHNMVHPLFDQIWFFVTIFLSVLILSGTIVFLFKRKVIS